MPQTCCLSDLPRGRRARVRALRGCGAHRSRLCSMGFTPGVEVELGQESCGMCRVFLRNSSIVLDQDTAQAIVCELEASEDAP